MLSLDELLARKPDVHPGLWDITEPLARFLDAHVGPGMVTLETGAGFSTLVILRKRVGAHVSVAPGAQEFEVIQRFCRQEGIETGPFRPVVARSQDYLPAADLPALDLVLIDGDWSFPIPFIDWYYTADRLKTGGLMVIDDIQMITRTVLADFMRADKKWEEVVRYRRGQFGAYRKVRHPIHDGKPAAQAYLYEIYPVKAVRRIPYYRPGRALRRAFYALPSSLQRPLQALYRKWAG